MWQREKLTRPAAVQAATDEYVAGEDVIGRWINECCEEDPKSKVLSAELYLSYGRWCFTNKEYQLSQQKLSSELKARGWRHDQTGGKRGFLGWRIRGDSQPSLAIDDEAPF